MTASRFSRTDRPSKSNQARKRWATPSSNGLLYSFLHHLCQSQAFTCCSRNRQERYLRQLINKMVSSDQWERMWARVLEQGWRPPTTKSWGDLRNGVQAAGAIRTEPFQVYRVVHLYYMNQLNTCPGNRPCFHSTCFLSTPYQIYLHSTPSI